MPSETSLFIIFAVSTSHTSDKEMKSPKEDILSAPLALAYAQARGESSPRSSTQYIFLSTSLKGSPTAAPAGETCLNEVAAGSPVASLSSFTSCHPLNASMKFIYPGLPLSTSIGSSPFSTYIRDGFWVWIASVFQFQFFHFYSPYVLRRLYVLIHYARIILS